MRISAIVDAFFELIVDGETWSPWRRWGSARGDPSSFGLTDPTADAHGRSVMAESRRQYGSLALRHEVGRAARQCIRARARTDILPKAQMNWKFLRRRKSESEPALGETDPAPALKVGHDASVRRREDDDLDRWPVARSIHRTITSAPLGWSTRIGLYGPCHAERCRKIASTFSQAIRFAELRETALHGIGQPFIDIASGA